MKDPVPECASIPPGFMVRPESQPEYLDVPAFRPGSDSNVGSAISDEQGFRSADDLAIIHHETGTRLTFRDLRSSSIRLANALDGLGVVPGDRVALRLPNRPEMIIAAVAAWRLGASVVPIPMQARLDELAFYLGDTRPVALVAQMDDAFDDDLHAIVDDTTVRQIIGVDGASRRSLPWESALAQASGTVKPPPRFVADLPAIVWHTGGTTGVPKACYHTHRRFLLAGIAAGSATGIAPGQRWAAAAPMGHALGFIYHTIFTLLHGATVVLIEGFSRPDVLAEALSTHRVDTFTAVAATWDRLQETAESRSDLAFDSLRRGYAMWQSASSSTIREAWQARGVELLNNFGSTAFATWVLVARPGEAPPGSLGRPAPGFDVRAIEPDSREVVASGTGEAGRMAVRGPTGLTYWNRDEYQERDVVDGWTLVDDLIRFDAEGNAEYLGRTDFIISTAGYKVVPVEVEGVLAQHPSVREVAVVGAPDPVRQEIVAAFVALRPGYVASDGLREELQDFVRQRLSPYKYPRRVDFIAALPRDPVGKVQPRQLKALLDAEADTMSR